MKTVKWVLAHQGCFLLHFRIVFVIVFLSFRTSLQVAIFVVHVLANYENIWSPLDHTKWLQHMDQTAQI